jgi:hypothetical protein
MKDNSTAIIVDAACLLIMIIARVISSKYPNSKATQILFKHYGTVNNIKYMLKKELLVTGIRNILISFVLFALFMLPILLPPTEVQAIIVVLIIMSILFIFTFLYFFGTGAAMLLFGLFRKSSYVPPHNSSKNS